MARNLAEEYHKTIVQHYLEPSRFTPGASPLAHQQELETLLNGMSIAKCTLDDFERDEPGGPLHLMYLFQTEQGIDFGLCPLFKMWNNHEGKQQCCYLDRGQNRPIRVGCRAQIGQCERQEAYAQFRMTTDRHNEMQLPILP